LFARGELMFAVSEQFKARLIELGCPADRVRVHRLGVDTRVFEFRERRLLPGERVRLLSMCRLVEKKGLEYGMRAFARVATLGAGFEWHIAGDGPLRASLEDLARELGVQDRVTFHGPVTRARALELLAHAHACLAPSVTARNGDQEGLPVTIVESTACGLPVVTTKHSGIPELVRHSETGYLAPERDVETLVGMLATMALEHGRWPALGRRGREIVEAEYDVHVLNDRLSALLEEVAAKGRRPEGGTDAGA
jgi:colanic acid/amylovoran biosynthesis glycosyltransferase